MTPSLPYTDLFIDFDDTLYDTRGNSSLALRELFDHFRLEQHFPSFDTFSQSYWSTNEALWMQYSHGEIDRDTLIVERFRRQLAEGDNCDTSTHYCLKMSDTFLELCSTKPGVVDGAHELLDHLRTRGYRLHICSNGFAEVQHRKIEAAGMRHHFDTVVLSDEAGANKPSAQFFDFAFAQTKADRAHTLMIGDNFSTDIVGAMNAGIDTAFFNRSHCPHGAHARGTHPRRTARVALSRSFGTHSRSSPTGSALLPTSRAFRETTPLISANCCALSPQLSSMGGHARRTMKKKQPPCRENKGTFAHFFPTFREKKSVFPPFFYSAIRKKRFATLQRVAKRFSFVFAFGGGGRRKEHPCARCR